MLLLTMKTLLSPLLLVLCTIVSYLWGDVVGGWLLGLPLASGPISLFLAVERGDYFAATAARSALLGMVAVGVFCLSYLALAKSRSWQLSFTGATLACLGSAALLSFVTLPLATTIPIVVAVLVVMNALLGTTEVPARSKSAPKVGGVAVRMVIAGAVVFTLTTMAGWLGGSITGLLAPLPVLAAIITVAAHRREGFSAIQGLLRGIVVGMWGGVAFFAVVGLFVGTAPEFITYAAATLAAGVVGWAATWVASLQPRLRLQKYLHHSALGSALHRLDCLGEGIALGDERRRIDVAAFE